MEPSKDVNFFKVKISTKGKPTATRYFGVRALCTFEDIIFDWVLNPICMRNYRIEYWYSMLGSDVFFSRETIGEALCTYTITLRKHGALSVILNEYVVEIDCCVNCKQIDLFEEYRSEHHVPELVEKKAKTKHLAKWLFKETRAVRWFLIQLNEHKDLNQLKGSMSKATYFRNLKICLEKGYIKEGRLVRKIMV